MKIEAIAFRTGSKVLTNSEIVDLVQSRSPASAASRAAQKLILHYFDKCGAKERRWCMPEETPIQLVTTSLQDAASQADINVDDIDCLIHVGLGRGFLEAGQSYFVAKALGLNRVHCFDVMDACNSWIRGLSIAQGLFATEKYRRIAVVNTECNALPAGPCNPVCFEVQSPEALKYKFPGITMGDGCSATILSREESGNFSFLFDSRPSLADACAIPLDNFQAFATPSDTLGLNGIGKFTCFGSILNSAKPVALELLRQALNKDPDPAMIFPHGHSMVWQDWAAELGVSRDLLRYNAFAKFGNLASASVPVAIATAIAEGAIRKGDKIVTWVGSGGMSFSTATFRL